jgi:HPt (histidine-containing phosphotransfer) domain-containing protein
MSPVPADARILDPAHLQRQTFGDRSLEREVLALFERQCDRLLPLIAAAERLPERADAAHTLKGAARAIGAWRVASLCETLEAALDQGGNPRSPARQAREGARRDPRRRRGALARRRGLALASPERSSGA